MTFVMFPRITYCNSIARYDYFTPGLILDKVPVHEVYNERLGFSRLYNDKEELLVLVCRWGGQWSVETKETVARHLLMDARIVKFFYDTYIVPLIEKPRSCGCGGNLTCRCYPDEAPMKKFLEKLGLLPVYLGGLRDLEIVTVPSNKQFRVESYDGCECLVFYQEQSWNFS